MVHHASSDSAVKIFCTHDLVQISHFFSKPLHHMSTQEKNFFFLDSTGTIHTCRRYVAQEYFERLQYGTGTVHDQKRNLGLPYMSAIVRYFPLVERLHLNSTKNVSFYLKHNAGYCTAFLKKKHSTFHSMFILRKTMLFTYSTSFLYRKIKKFINFEIETNMLYVSFRLRQHRSGCSST
jgi:hypothetical protein